MLCRAHDTKKKVVLSPFCRKEIEARWVGHPGHGGRKAWRWYLSPALPGSELAFPLQAKASKIRGFGLGAFSLLTPASHTAKLGEGGPIEETRATRTIQARGSSYDAEPSLRWLPTPLRAFWKELLAAMAPICHLTSSRGRSLPYRPSSGCQKLPSWLSLRTCPSHSGLSFASLPSLPPAPLLCRTSERQREGSTAVLSCHPFSCLLPILQVSRQRSAL